MPAPPTLPPFRHRGLQALARPRYTAAALRAIEARLEQAGSLHFPALPTGLFSAGALAPELARASGYGNVWVRDNCHIANAHFETGETAVALRVARALCGFFATQRRHLDAIVRDPTLARDPMRRPHVRFDGLRLEELGQPWAHDQNDALGYFLWLSARLVRAGCWQPAVDELATLVRFPAYFAAIRYWQDEDSGHWEEARRVSASSIGAVVAGLRELRSAFAEGRLPAPGEGGISPAALDSLIDRGREALAEILPDECVQPDPGKRRAHDAALLFLIAPLRVISPTDPTAETIVRNVRTHLEGEHGIRRYLGDSYWAADYRTALPLGERTADFSARLGERDRLLRPGEEAQWCLFDPILSLIFAERSGLRGGPAELAAQTWYLNRSLGQLTGEHEPLPLRCPEAYFLERGSWVANDHTPLLWTQANLMLALHAMRSRLERGAARSR